jgi:DNA polymerase III epsilon subunit-like protein
MHWTDIPIHFIDFEGAVGSGILEFGVVTLQGGSVTDTHTRLCGATGGIRPEDRAVHGIETKDVAGLAPFSAEFGYFATLRENGPFAAHYAHVENSLIKAAWPYPRMCRDFSRAGRMGMEWGPWIDTGRLYAGLFPRLESGRLGQLVATGGLQAELDAMAEARCPAGRRKYHAALYDALAGALLLLGLLRRAEFSEATIPWLIQASTANPDKRAALQQDELF